MVNRDKDDDEYNDEYDDEYDECDDYYDDDNVSDLKRFVSECTNLTDTDGYTLFINISSNLAVY